MDTDITSAVTFYHSYVLNSAYIFIIINILCVTTYGWYNRKVLGIMYHINSHILSPIFTQQRICHYPLCCTLIRKYLGIARHLCHIKSHDLSLTCTQQHLYPPPPIISCVTSLVTIFHSYAL